MFARLLNLVYLLILLTAFPVLVWRMLRHGKYRDGWAQKFLGRLPSKRSAFPAPRSPLIWFHAVSVGEVLQLEPVLRELQCLRPDVDVVVTTTTATGLAVAKEKFPQHAVCYFPLDFPWAVRNAMKRIRPDVVVLVELELWPNFIREASRRGIPLVFYNRTLKDRRVNAVCCDQAEGERWLVNRLVEAGHESFGLISGPEDSSVSMERTQGAVERLHELDVKSVTVVPGDYSYESGASGLLELKNKLGKLPDAVVCANDVMAIGCMDAARYRLGVKVPDDLSVVGFDGVGPAQWQSYDLTTVRQPVRRMTEAAVSMILERVEQPDLPSEKRTFSGILVEGGSARI